MASLNEGVDIDNLPGAAEQKPEPRSIPVIREFSYKIGEEETEDGSDVLCDYIHIKEVVGRGGFCKVRRVECKIELENSDGPIDEGDTS
jgi:hypothetical protein